MMTHVRCPAPEILAERRRLADTFGLPAECPHRICRRARRCRGPRGATPAFPGETLPGCLAVAFDVLHAPAARWQALMDTIARAEARLAESG